MDGSLQSSARKSLRICLYDDEDFLLRSEPSVEIMNFFFSTSYRRSLSDTRSISDSETSTADWTSEAKPKTTCYVAREADLHHALKNVEALRHLEDGWAGEESVAPAEAAIRDALQFLAKLPQQTSAPIISAAIDGEIVIEWRLSGKKAIVGIDGNGTFGYTFFKDNKFVPGVEEGLLSNDELPSDLIEYIIPAEA